MAISHPVLDILFLLSVIIIWFMIAYQLILTFAGYRYRRKVNLEQQEIKNDPALLEAVSILIPARNEELVIKKTVQRMLDLDYPENKIEIIIVNDGSTDNTANIVKEFAEQNSRIKLIDMPKGEIGTGKVLSDVIY